ncbi:MAG: F0F1 ATP synthase subunit delta [Gammaproteobacteria bacterium]|nr:F0F1 ATP synthase subunit delta [Gammaproteobacteria bacterium]
MQQLITTARPYANAAFDFAAKNQQIEEWQQWLQTAAVIATHPQVKNTLKNPQIPAKNIVDLFIDVLGKKSSDAIRNFIQLLAHYRRLNVLPEIANLFDQARAAYEKILPVAITSTFELTQQQEETLKKALENRFKKTIHLHKTIDKTLLGGAIIRVGNWVLDGSGLTKLKRLKACL